MDTYGQTRSRLIEINPAFARLPEEWTWRAYLRGADLRGADLRGAYLREITMSWQSHALIAEILRRAANKDIEKTKVAGLIAMGQANNWCWEWYVKNCSNDPLFPWAIAELRKWVKDGDDAPEILRQKSLLIGKELETDEV